MSAPDEINAALAARLEQISGWDRMNAHERTMRCCAEMLKLGIQPPGWEVIRRIIGKGSATDINRAKQAFWTQQGQALQRQGGALPDVPEVLAPHVLGLWQEAVMQARAEFREQTQRFEAQILESSTRIEQLDAAKTDAEQRTATLQSTLDEMTLARNALQEQLADTRTKGEQTTKALLDAQKALIEQREAFHKELTAAIGRLEGVEKHALLEIARARSEAKDRINEITQERDRLTKRLEKMRAEADAQTTMLQNTRQQLALREQESAMLGTRLQEKDRECRQLSKELSQLSRRLEKEVPLPTRTRKGAVFGVRRRKTLSNARKISKQGNAK